MGEFKFRALVLYVALLVIFLSLINMIFNLHRFAFAAEFLLLLLSMLIVLIAVLGIASDMRWAWVLITWLLGFIFVDIFLINSMLAEKVPYFLYTVAVIVAAFFISFFSIHREEEEFIEKPKETVQKKELERKVEKLFKPGKYIASMSGTKFHSPKCDWAKKVKKTNAVWFNSKEEAIKAGYKADACVK